MSNSSIHTLTIRLATPSDNVLLAQLGAETFSDAFAAENAPEDMELYLKRSFSREIQASELADQSSAFLIAQRDGEAVGYSRIRNSRPAGGITADRPVEIVRIYARTAWIGRGVGSALIQGCLQQARTRGSDVIWLDVWEENARAIKFYEKWGFAQIGTQPFRLGNDIQNDLLMARPVATLGAA